MKPSAGRGHILAIDLGTSGPKVGIVSARGEVLGHEFEPNGLTLLPGGGAEQDPAQWWQTIMTAARRVLGRGLVPPEQIAAICCTSQWSGTVPVGRDGMHVSNAIIWMDSRGAPHVREVTDGLVKVQGYGLWRLMQWIRLTGGVPSNAGKDPTAHILFIKNERPEVHAATYKYLEPKDWLNVRLTGRFAATFDSIVLHWVTDNRRIDKVDYHPWLLRATGIEREKLPDLVRAVDVLGPILPQIADDLGLPRDVQVVAGSPDVQSASVGSGAVRDFEGHLYFGTSSWLTCHVPFKKTDLSHNMASLPSSVPGRYLVTNEQESAGACIKFLRDNILYHKDALGSADPPADFYPALDSIAAGIPAGSGRLLFTPWLYGERTPIEDRYVRSCIYNLSLETTREHIVRAVMEGVAYNSRWLLGAVERFVGRRMDALNMIGGGANSAVWCQICADVLGRRIRQVRDPIQANMRGAAIIASVALGNIAFDDVHDLVDVAHTYEPDPANAAVYDEMFAEYLEIYRRNRKIFARLNRTRLPGKA